jgi:predicted metalloprotease with PDZ domain
MKKLILSSLLWLAVVVSATAQNLRMDYTVAFPQPHTHLYEIALSVSNIAAPQLDLSLPVWTPGSYLVREYARHVQDFSARNAADQPLTWQKTDKATWRVATNGAKSLTVFYRVYANELATQTSHLDASHAYFNGASLFMYPSNISGAKAQPYRVRFKLEGATANWRVSSPLALAPDAAGWYTAPNYDVLIDSPHEIGTHRLIEFKVRDKIHRIALWPNPFEAADISDKQLADDFAKIVEEGAKIFGELPYEHYLFIVGVQPFIGGGTEHLNSNVSLTRPDSFKTKRGYQGFLGLESHEYFHCWNVKRIRPITLGPFDYQREVYTNNLWVSEGFTSYYGDLLLRRAGLVSANEYLMALGQTIAGYRNAPGRKQQSAATASFNAWIKHYRPDENSPNTAMSYYTSGELLGLVFDLEIRARTNNAKSLDDVMRLLLEKYGLPKPGFTDAELKAAFESVAGADLTEFFTKYVYGTEDIDFERYLKLAGIELKGVYRETAPPLNPTNKKPGTLGIRLRGNVVGSVLADTPAYHAGLNASDELIALDGRKLDAANADNRLGEIREGQRVTLMVFRREKMMTFEMTAAAKPFDSYSLALQKEMTAEQKALLKGWLREEVK